MIKYQLLTNKGLIREANEDALVFKKKAIQSEDYYKEGSILFNKFYACIFDGVGGEDFGEIASLECAKAIAIRKKLVRGRKEFFDLLNELNELVLALQKEKNNRRMMTTFCGVCVIGKTVRATNVGDSCIYLFKNGNVIEKKSVDDTYKNQLFKNGVKKEDIDEEEVAHIITNCLGLGNFDKNKAHYFEFEFKKGDFVVLMSDGISDLLTPKELLEIIKENKKESSLRIQKEIINRGAHDNYSLIILEA